MSGNKICIEQSESRIQVRIPNNVDVCFELRNGELIGIRDVLCDGVPLRNPEKVWKPYMYTAEGINYLSFRFRNAYADGDTAVIEADAVGTRAYRMEEDDEYLCDILDIRSADEPVIDRFTWRLRGSTLEQSGRTFNGFSYVYEFASSHPERKIYRVFDMATWEVGGKLDGNTLLLQGQVNPPVVDLAKDDFFTTACNYYSSEMGAIMDRPKRVSMQRLPRIATLQPFDFLSHPSGILFNYFDPVDDVMTVVQSDRGEDMLHVVDELRKPLSDRFMSSPKHILFHRTPATMTREAVRNLWCDALDRVHGRERDRYGIAASPVLPRVWLPQIVRDEFRFGSDAVPRTQALHYLADKVLDRWAEMGVKEICSPSVWVSDYTVDRLTTKDQSGLQGGLTVGGICCARVHEIDPVFGGPDGMAYLVKRAHSLGMSVQLWWATHLSRRAPIFQQRPDFMVKSRDGQPGCAGIGPHAIIPMNLSNPECFEWELGKLKELYERTGIDGFFNDSYGNYTFLPVNYNDPMRISQQDAYARLVAELQKIGMRTFTVEGMGPWGVGHFGMELFPSEPGKKRSFQNALDWWLGQEDMMYRLNMGIGNRIWQGREQDCENFGFRCMAFGGRFGFTQHESGVEMWNGWLKDLNRCHAQIAPLMGKREILPEGNGVLWHEANGTEILFAFRSFDHPLSKGMKTAKIETSGEHAAPSPGGVLKTEPGSIYKIAKG
jgi:hypothetical protein